MSIHMHMHLYMRACIAHATWKMCAAHMWVVLHLRCYFFIYFLFFTIHNVFRRCTHAYIRTCMHACMHACMRAYIHACICVCIRPLNYCAEFQVIGEHQSIHDAGQHKSWHHPRCRPAENSIGLLVLCAISKPWLI